MNTKSTRNNTNSECISFIKGTSMSITGDFIQANALSFVLSPDATYTRKLDIIEKSNDMTTQEKLVAIEHAETKHNTDKLIHLTIAIVSFAIFTKEGRQFIDATVKKLSCA